MNGQPPHNHTHTHIIRQSHKLTHNHTQSHTFTHNHTQSHTITMSHTITRTLTHNHTHTIANLCKRTPHHTPSHISVHKLHLHTGPPILKSSVGCMHNQTPLEASLVSIGGGCSVACLPMSLRSNVCAGNLRMCPNCHVIHVPNCTIAQIA